MDLSGPDSSELHQQDIQSKHPNTTRRSFLKKLGLAFVGGALEVETGLVSRILKPFEKMARESGVLQEGNALQMVNTLKILISDYLTTLDNPLAPEAEKQMRKNLVVAWLKFNGAIAFAYGSFAQKMASHFLYGEGKKLDISASIVEALKNDSVLKRYKDQLEADEKTDDQTLLKTFIEQTFGRPPRDPMIGTYIGGKSYKEDDFGDGPIEMLEAGGLYISLADDPRTYFVGKATKELEGKRLRLMAIAAPIDSPSFHYSLGDFTMVATGTVKKVTDHMVLEHPSIDIYDTYDWTQAEDLRISNKIEYIINGLGLADFFVDPMWDDLKKQEVTIFDYEGNLLVQQGFANNFDVEAHFNNYKSIDIYDEVCRKPPDKFIQDKKVTLVEIK
jgi:hypothetical protein